jgi:hypothetical protein
LWKTIASAELRKLTEIDLTSLAETPSWLGPASFLRVFNPSVVTSIVINLKVVRLTYVPNDLGVPTQVFHPRVLVFYGQRWQQLLEKTGVLASWHSKVHSNSGAH